MSTMIQEHYAYKEVIEFAVKFLGYLLGLPELKTENTEDDPFCDINDEAGEEAMETPLNVLDHWKNGKEEEIKEGKLEASSWHQGTRRLTHDPGGTVIGRSS